MSTISPVFAYIGLGLSLFFGLSAVVAVIVTACLLWIHRKDKDPIEIMTETLQDIKKRLPIQDDADKSRTGKDKSIGMDSGGTTENE